MLIDRQFINILSTVYIIGVWKPDVEVIEVLGSPGYSL